MTAHLKTIANPDLQDAMNQATALVHTQAKALAPVEKGQLAGSIHMQVDKSPSRLQGRVYTNVEYAPYVEFGTGVKGNGTYPYAIKGLGLTYRDKGWVYQDEDTGEWVYTKGQKAQPYLYPALKEKEKIIKQLFQNSVKTALKAKGKGGR